MIRRALAILAVLTTMPTAALAHGGHLEGEASARGSGMGHMVVGPDPYDLGSHQEIDGEIRVEVIDRGNRWSSLQNVDAMHVEAEWTAGAARYKVTIDQAMPRHPQAKYTTWFGVVYDAEMHGDTRIGTNKIPKVQPEISLWGYAVVERDGQVISKNAPAHVMVMEKAPMPGVMLDVATEDKSLIGSPDGYLVVMWPKAEEVVLSSAQNKERERTGWLALAGIVVLFGWLAERERKLG